MRKISKISLVAAVAVAGLSTANAQPLEEAIKNVEVNGSVVYRYDNFDNQKGTKKTSDTNHYKIGLNLASKVNDYVKFNSRFIVGAKDNYGFASLNDKRDGGYDGSADVSLSQAYFALTAIPNTVINIGKQGLATPYTVAQDINGNEQSGTGILALTNIADVVTLGAGYFNATNLDKSFELNATQGAGYGKTSKITAPISKDLGGGKWMVGSAVTQDNILDGGSDVYVATAQADLDVVKLEAWYAGLQDTLNSFTLAATSNVELAENAKLGLEARYVSLVLNNKTKKGLDLESDKNSMFRLAVDGKFDIVNARVAFTKTGKHGGLTAFDQDAKNTSLGWAISSNGVADAKYWQAALGADILENLNFTVNYGSLKSKDAGTHTVNGVAKSKVLIDDIKASEVYGQLTYKMSKNLSTYLRYGKYTEKAHNGGSKIYDQNRGRIQVAYTF